ncbi:MAG: lipopolysaccharide biosynthesis protein [Pseudomonadota bacterium]
MSKNATPSDAAPPIKAPGKPAGKPFKARQIASGTFWAALDNWSQQIVQLVAFLYIGNVIGPAAMGVWGVAFLFANLMYALLVNSFTEVVVQRRDLDEEHKEAAFWTVALLGFVAMLVGIAIAPLWGLAFGLPEVTLVLQLLSPIFVAYGVSSYYQAIVRREMQFQILAFRSVVSVGLGAGVAIYFARQGFGVWSLVLFQLIWRFLDFFILAVASRWAPRLRFSRRHFSELLNFGGYSLGASVISYFNANIDRYIVGFFLPKELIGLYIMARRLVDSLIFALTGVFVNVSLSVFSRLQDQPKKFRESVVTSTRLSALVGFPTFAGLAVVADPLVRSFLSDQWLGMIPLVQLLAIGGALTSVTYILGTAIRGAGRADLTFKINFAMTVFRGLIFLAAIGAGIAAVAFMNAFAFLVMVPVTLFFLARVVGVKRGAVLSALLPSLWSTAAMVGVALWAGHAAAAHLPPIWQLLIIVCSGVVTYSSVLAITNRSSIALLFGFLREK